MNLHSAKWDCVFPRQWACLMIDRDRRDRFAELLRHFVAGLITNEEFEDRLEDEILPDGFVRTWPEPFLWMMYGRVWMLYSDLREHKLRGEDAIPREERREIARCIMFLYSDRAYELPLIDLFHPAGCLLSSLTFGFADKWAMRKFGRQVDLDLWPYRSRDDLEEDRHHPRLLAGKE